MKKFKIILSDPPIVKNQRQRTSFPSFGILYLSAYIKKKVKRRGGILKIKYTLKNDLANINIRDLRYLLSRARDYF
jgi:hypothetical protein